MVSWCGLIHIRKRVSIGYIQFNGERQPIVSFYLPTSHKVAKCGKTWDLGFITI